MEIAINVDYEYMAMTLDYFGQIISGLAPVLAFLFGLWVAFYIINKVIRMIKII